MDDLLSRCKSGKEEEVKEHIAKFGSTAIVNARDAYGQSCLYLSCKSGKNSNLTRLLLQNGADANDKRIGGNNWHVLTAASCWVSK